jgi:transcriptional regulator with XRE-family HTH domain
MNPQLTYVARLRRERQRRGISLDQIATATRVKRELLEAFERNDLTDWPRGLYARAWIRGYAIAVGLEPVETVDEFCRLYLHGDRRARTTIREIASITATESEYRDEFGHEERRRGARASRSAGPPAWYSPVVHAWRSLRGAVVALWLRHVVSGLNRPVSRSDTPPRSA